MDQDLHLFTKTHLFRVKIQCLIQILDSDFRFSVTVKNWILYYGSKILYSALAYQKTPEKLHKCLLFIQLKKIIVISVEHVHISAVD